MDQLNFATCSWLMICSKIISRAVHGVHLSNAALLNVHEAVS